MIWKVNKTRKILVVEDNSLVQRVLKHQFEALKCTVETADNAAQAFQKMKNDHYHLIILDLGLPDKNGCDLAIDIQQWQAQYHQYTPLVALSAHVDPEQEQRCYQAGITRVLTKPLSQRQAQDLLKSLTTTQANFHHQPKFDSDNRQERKPHEQY